MRSVRMDGMRRLLILALLLLLGGCASGPLLDNPALLTPTKLDSPQNPVYVPLSHEAYNLVFDNVLHVLNDTGFEILESNRYDGHIETLPRTAPGVEQFFKSGSPAISERVIATFQSYRQRASVKIMPAESGGFFIQVVVLKELEDLPRTMRSLAGSAFFFASNNVDRQLEQVDPTIFEAAWIPKGRDMYLEQDILCRLKACM
jgi:hypothetical protein